MGKLQNRDAVVSGGIEKSISLGVAICLAGLAAGTFLQGPWAGVAALGGCLVLLAATVRSAIDEHRSFDPRRRMKDLAAFGVLLAIAAVPRFYALETFPGLPNVDEGINGCIVLNILDGRGPGPVLMEVFGEEAYGFYVQAALFDLLGFSMASFRVVAAFLGMLFPPLVYVLARPFTGMLPAFIIGLLVCFDPTHIRYAREGNTIAHAATLQALAFLYLRLVFVRGDLASCAGLGLSVALGCHVYPAFRAVTCVAILGMLLAFRYTRDTAGPVLGGGLIFAGMSPFLLPGNFDMWFARIQHVTWLGRLGPDELAEMAAAVPRLAGTFIGTIQRQPGGQLFTPLVAALCIVGFVECLRRWKRFGAPGAAVRLGLPDRASAAYWLGAMIATGAASPIVCQFEPQQARRYLLLLLPVYLLAAIGLDRAFGSIRGRAARFLGAAALAAAIGLGAWNGVKTYTTWVERSAVETQILANYAQFTRTQWPAAMPASMVSVPFIFGQNAANPEVQFLERALGLSLSRGLNPYPVAETSGPIHYVLGDPVWDRFIKSLFPDGRQWTWGDAELDVYPLDIWTVRGEELTKEQGLSYRNGGWSGYLYIPESGRREVLLKGPGRLTEPAGPGWMAEGWHPIRIERCQEPPVLQWRTEHEHVESPIPAYFLRRSLADYAQLTARPAAAAPLKTQVLASRLRTVLDPGDWLQDIAFARDRVYEAHTSADMIQCFDLDGKPIPEWKGLKGLADTLGPIPREPIPIGYELSLDCSPEGDLAIADASLHRIIFAGPDGTVRRTIQLDPIERSPGGVAFDPARREFLVSNGHPGQLSRYRVDGTHVADWWLPGALALAVRPDGQEIYVTVPARGGIAVLDPYGDEIDFLRCSEINALTRIGCDDQGRILGMVSEKRLFAFDAARRLVLQLSPMPFIPGVGDGYAATSVRRGPRGQLFLAVEGMDKGWAAIQLRESGAGR